MREVVFVPLIRRRNSIRGTFLLPSWTGRKYDEDISLLYKKPAVNCGFCCIFPPGLYATINSTILHFPSVLLPASSFLSSPFHSIQPSNFHRTEDAQNIEAEIKCRVSSHTRKQNDRPSNTLTETYREPVRGSLRGPAKLTFVEVKLCGGGGGGVQGSPHCLLRDEGPRDKRGASVWCCANEAFVRVSALLMFVCFGPG